jgi:uncharacterized protein involved in exopolysaccharide biosynthesis
MSNIQESVLATRSSLGTHYEETLRLTVANLWQRKAFILATVATALVLGILAALLWPKRYTAEAYVRGSFAMPDAIVGVGKANNGAYVNVDASLLVETRSRLLQSHQLARQVVDRLGLEQLRGEVTGSFISSAFNQLFGSRSAANPGYEKDMAAARLLRGLAIRTEPRVYLITVRYTASNPRLAALIANAFVAEFLHTSVLEVLSAQRTSAEDVLRENLATFGDKHPNVKMAKAKLAAIDALAESQKRKTPAELEWTGNESVTLAEAIALPPKPSPWLCIGLALLLGLIGGIAFAVLAPGAALAAPDMARRYLRERIGKFKRVFRPRRAT